CLRSHTHYCIRGQGEKTHSRMPVMFGIVGQFIVAIIPQRLLIEDRAEDMHKYDAVFCDPANTLLSPFPSVGDIYAQVASRYSVTTTGTEVQHAFRQGWGKMQTVAERERGREGRG